MDGNELATMLLALNVVTDRSPGVAEAVDEAKEAVAKAMTALAEAAKTSAEFSKQQKSSSIKAFQELVKQ